MQSGILLILFVSQEIAVRFFGYKPPAISESQLKKTKQVEFTPDTGETYKHAVTGKYMYFVNTDKVTICNNSGGMVAEKEIVTSNPVVKQSGKYVVVGDVGGTNVYIFKEDDLKNTITAKKVTK